MFVFITKFALGPAACACSTYFTERRRCICIPHVSTSASCTTYYNIKRFGWVHNSELQFNVCSCIHRIVTRVGTTGPHISRGNYSDPTFYPNRYQTTVASAMRVEKIIIIIPTRVSTHIQTYACVCVLFLLSDITKFSCHYDLQVNRVQNIHTRMICCV